MLTLIFTFIVGIILPVFTSSSVEVLRILPEADRFVDDLLLSPALPARWLAGVTLGQLHPIRGGNPRKVAVGVCEDARVGRAVADLVVEDVDGVAGLGHREGSGEGISVLADFPQRPTARVSKDKTTALTWVSVALSASRVECGCIHPFWIFAFCLFNLIQSK